MEHLNRTLEDSRTASLSALDGAFEAAGLHSIRLTARHARAALTAVDRAVSSGGAEVRRLYLTSVGGRSVADVTVAEISATAARQMADFIAASVGVEAVSVEHLYSGT